MNLKVINNLYSTRTIIIYIDFTFGIFGRFVLKYGASLYFLNSGQMSRTEPPRHGQFSDFQNSVIHEINSLLALPLLQDGVMIVPLLLLSQLGQGSGQCVELSVETLQFPHNSGKTHSGLGWLLQAAADLGSSAIIRRFVLRETLI